MDQKWNSASLRIVSKTITPAVITKTLGIEPTCAYAIKTPVNPRNPSGKIRQESSWILESGLDESEPLKLHISELLLLIESYQIRLIAHTIKSQATSKSRLIHESDHTD